MSNPSRGRVLIVAGSDSGGGAGIQADIKAVTMLGGFAATAITALTAQNTLGVHGVHEVPAAFVAQQMRVVLEDIGADAIKTGMLNSPSVIEAIVRVLDDVAPHIPLVVDPVMVAKGGARLLQPEAEVALIEQLIPRATIITPNLPEAEALIGKAIPDAAAMPAAAHSLLGLRPKAVLLKGGHLDSSELLDLLQTPEGETRFLAQRIDSRSTHGTGCTLASAIAAGLAFGKPLRQAVAEARDYVRQAMLTAPGLGQGHGPLNHGWPLNH
ncbi:bifunctional hydroxymethylpyrimidine kinase/phosphomethylpyrimidine kinase [Ferrovibrio sp.]|uniref:bifunctional hydroxymethylpyrimidine kinase/phosphomethylpyrimidine kinase n=1 Tax=Ferrovibrio sp. TaxID=1917215 RepID=UPI0025C4919E|nr:bifunctional hydroxymethylpyrimidine kinase/phosphomethylpyrimidine kinase [Ferrovibrio sp.]MBX3453060.1 bifunctional hydroxymethylpyrimidine kinase/phosphomethylpyrimidine kinase [Ferrovibrio sp.]